MVRTFKTCDGMQYHYNEENNRLSGGNLPHPMVVADISPIMVGGPVHVVLADSKYGVVKFDTGVVVDI